MEAHFHVEILTRQTKILHDSADGRSSGAEGLIGVAPNSHPAAVADQLRRAQIIGKDVVDPISGDRHRWVKIGDRPAVGIDVVGHFSAVVLGNQATVLSVAIQNWCR